jgi:hypothetical protein
MSETHILIMLLWMYFQWNWEFGSALSELRDFEGGGFEPTKPPSPFGTPLLNPTRQRGRQQHLSGYGNDFISLFWE